MAKDRMITPADVRIPLYETRSAADALGTAGRSVQVVADLAVPGPHVPRRGLVVDAAQVLHLPLPTSWILGRPQIHDNAAVERLSPRRWVGGMPCTRRTRRTAYGFRLVISIARASAQPSVLSLFPQARAS